MNALLCALLVLAVEACATDATTGSAPDQAPTPADTSGAHGPNTERPLAGRPHACAPDDWDVSEMVEALAGSSAARPDAEAGVLSWRIYEDDRPLYIEAAIVALHDGDRWALAHLYRHPREARPSDWTLSMVYDVPYVSFETYAAPPTRAEIDAFLDATWWTDRQYTGFRRLDGGDCDPWW